MSDEPLSETSSSSSFVPVQLQDAIQVIDEFKNFNNEILEYINKTSISNNNYHIISVFGSQSTGKSTLLNKLFNTNFDVMNENNRQQTTKGIWLAHSPSISSTKGQLLNKSTNILVMDVEGTDGRERGEDQDFERKAALFALSTSEILILNVWEHQIGLYQGANMGLLKTVFEVNLTLFGRSKLEKKNSADHKVLLLVVIRDHVGNTPIESLSNTITQDLKKMWNSLTKPQEFENLKFEDFFDIDFHALNHKILQPEQFVEGVEKLGDRILDENDLFKPEYHHNIPIDGWTLYAENCWEQIENNKDLDLPTQQILVSQFKCDEIVENIYNEFLNKFKEHFRAIQDEPNFEELGSLFNDLKNDILEDYDQLATKYNQSVYESKRSKLDTMINSKFKDVFDIYSKQLIENSKLTFEKDLVALKGQNFIEESKRLSSNILNSIAKNLELISLNGSIDYKDLTTTFEKDINQIILKQQQIELDNIINKSIKKLNNNLTKYMQFEINDPNDKTWDNILNKFNELIKEISIKYPNNDFKLNTTKQQNEESITKFKFKSWNNLYENIHKLIYKEKILNLLISKFDDKFRYDLNGLPKLYQNSVELENNFKLAKDQALRILPILTLAKLSDDSEIIPDFNIFDTNLRTKYGLKLFENEEEDDEDEDHQKNLETNAFAEIINESEKSEIYIKFKKEIDAKFIETKRSIVQHITSIPYYIYIIIIILGWNEFMAIIRNPFTFALSILLLATIYILYSMNLLKPAITIATKLIDEIIIAGKTKLKEILIDDFEIQSRNLSKISGIKHENHEEEEEINNKIEEPKYEENIELEEFKKPKVIVEDISEESI
ncbi:SEY1 [Candida pseudojiufengensis]|uniref:SEY1 n=1 Tax=Candida pseudojiufengensis TaxID=497109 RepID=UPI0022243754|nr:SEY1 [Candida pseudojiufengensis]KAI5961437.1 SEY1 [Candida pseudojiufengensis]